MACVTKCDIFHSQAYNQTYDIHHKHGILGYNILPYSSHTLMNICFLFCCFNWYQIIQSLFNLSSHISSRSFLSFRTAHMPKLCWTTLKFRLGELIPEVAFSVSSILTYNKPGVLLSFSIWIAELSAVGFNVQGWKFCYIFLGKSITRNRVKH